MTTKDDIAIISEENEEKTCFIFSREADQEADTPPTNKNTMFVYLEEEEQEEISKRLDIVRPSRIVCRYRRKDAKIWETVKEMCPYKDFECTVFPWQDDEMGDFLAIVETPRYQEIPTGLERLDIGLGGGFMAQQLVTIGAAPGMGKTTLATQMTEGLARRGIKVYYLNLEMSKEQMLAKSLTRYAALINDKADVSALDVLRLYKLPEGDVKRETILKAAHQWQEELQGKIEYNPEGVTRNLDSIMGYLEEVAKEEKGPFVVCIDYLHLVGADDNLEATENIKVVVEALKNYAVKHSAIVLAISANNRDSNKRGEATMESGRDSSAIEYGADAMIELAYYSVVSKICDLETQRAVMECDTEQEFKAMLDECKSKYKDDIDLVERIWKYKDRVVLKIVKGRWTKTKRCTMEFDGRHNLFKPVETIEKPTPENMRKPTPDENKVIDTEFSRPEGEQMQLPTTKPLKKRNFSKGGGIAYSKTK